MFKLTHMYTTQANCAELLVEKVLKMFNTKGLYSELYKLYSEKNCHSPAFNGEKSTICYYYYTTSVI